MALSLLFAGAARSADTPLPPFRLDAFAAYERPGNGTIEGRLVVQLSGGALATRAHSPVLALPQTPFTVAWLRRSASDIRGARGSGATLPEPALPDVVDRFARATHSDDAGYFHFRNLPNGRYLVRGRLTVAFPRSLERLQNRKTVYDYSFVWLQSEAVVVHDGVAPDVVFHIVARRDKIAGTR